MAANIYTLARPYAKAAFAFAKESGHTDKWAKELALLADAIKIPDMKNLLGNPTLTPAQLFEIIKACLPKLDESVQNFLHILTNNHRLIALPAIVKLFNEYKAEAEHTMDVNVISAFPLDEKQRESFAEVLGKRLQRKVNINSTTDESLIGGAIIRAGDEVIDGSVRGRLTQLADNLLNG
jgi:F-type H+-transporting ATPase subunit delta